MRRPTYLFTPHETSQPAQKPKFSQRSGRQDFTLEGMLVGRPKRTHPSRTRQTQGIALVVVLLSAMILMVSLLAISATMTISSQRTTADQGVTLQAQYAAEAGIAYAQVRFTEAQALFPLIKFERTVGRSSIKDAVDDYCGGTAPRTPPTIPLGKESTEYCPGNAANLTSRNFSIFANYITNFGGANPDDQPYLSGYSTTDLTKRQTYWRDMFAGSATRSGVSTAAPTGTSATYQVKYGFTPDRIDMINAGYRIFFKPVAIESTGTISASGKVVATKRLQASVGVKEYSIDVSRDAFSKYNYFANRRKLPKNADGTLGNYLVFADNETFEGRVHVNGSDPDNGAPYFTATSSQGGARFNGGFTTAATELYWSNGSPKVPEETLFPGGYKLGTDVVDLPENANSQRRAVIGGDADNLESISNEDMARAYGRTLSNFTDGVYYGAGATSTNGGGIYVKGNVDDLKLSTKNNRQVIAIKQTTGSGRNAVTKTTTFTQTSDTCWKIDITNPNSSNNYCNAKFNGLIFVEGNIGSGGSQLDVSDNPAYAEGLGGDGTNAPDIAANSQLTVAASGDVNIKRNLTYTEVPDSSKTEEQLLAINNVLGVYSEGGNVKVDGPQNEDIELHATIMAVGPKRDPNSTDDGKGFGTIGYTRDRKAGVNISPKIKLLGGIIEEQSQGVGQTGRKYVEKQVLKSYVYKGRRYYYYDTEYEEVSTKGGYNRAFDWDKRYEKGVAPPYFPTQLKYAYSCQEGDPAETSGDSVACARNTAVTWVQAKGY